VVQPPQDDVLDQGSVHPPSQATSTATQDDGVRHEDHVEQPQHEDVVGQSNVDQPTPMAAEQVEVNPAAVVGDDVGQVPMEVDNFVQPVQEDLPDIFHSIPDNERFVVRLKFILY
jgi:hypothetical protein